MNSGRCTSILAGSPTTSFTFYERQQQQGPLFRLPDRLPSGASKQPHSKLKVAAGQSQAQRVRVSKHHDHDHDPPQLPPRQFNVCFSTGRRRDFEELWKIFFADPSQWWDHRPEKENARYPDFKHKQHKGWALWLRENSNPPWVEAELAAVVPGRLHVSIFSWNRKLERHLAAGENEKVMELFEQMQREAVVTPTRLTFLAVLDACAGLRALEEGRQIHLQIIESGWCKELDLSICSSLVNMYLKCGSLEDARPVFNRMPRRDLDSWNAMILAYVKCGQGLEALKLGRQMQREGSGEDADSITYVGLLNACAMISAVDEGLLLHQEIVERGYDSDMDVCTALVRFYVRCVSVERAWRVFSKMQDRSEAAWTTMIVGYVKSGQADTAIELFRVMQSEGITKPKNPAFLVEVLRAFASAGALKEGQRFHEDIIRLGYLGTGGTLVANGILDMYVKCGSIEDAWRTFKVMLERDVASWNIMILGCVAFGQWMRALELYGEMMSQDDDGGLHVDAVTFIGVLRACASGRALEKGRNVHQQIIQRGFAYDVHVCASLAGMYATCGQVEDAWNAFKKMTFSPNDVDAWGTMILGFVKGGDGRKALELFRQMHQQQGRGTEPGPSPRPRPSLSPAIFVGLLSACATEASLENGKHVHEQILRSASSCESDDDVCSSLIDMYARCGSIQDAHMVFNKTTPTRHPLPWNAMLGAYAMHGCTPEAISHFEQMCRVGVEINEVTFFLLLSALSHSGLVDKGMHYFELMTKRHHIAPTIRHYTCMVNLLGRAGHLAEAKRLIRGIKDPNKPDVKIWVCLLEACRMHGCVEIGERAFNHILDLDPANVTGHILMSSIYSAACMWEKSQKVDQQLVNRGLEVPVGRSTIEVGNVVHAFTTGNGCQHSQFDEISAELRRLSTQIKEMSCTPCLQFVQSDADDNTEEIDLCWHADTLAIGFGLISTPPGTTLRVLKNLEIDRGCHTAIKTITRVVQRPILVKDMNRFHHFQDGRCSCQELVVG